MPWRRWRKLPLRLVVAATLALTGAALTAIPLSINAAGAASTPVFDLSWHQQAAVLPIPTELEGVSCPSTSLCVAVGRAASNTEAILQSTDGGVTWTNATVPSVYGTLDAVSCPTVETCITSGLVSSDGGATWSATAASGIVGITSISCGSVTDCVAIGAVGLAQTPVLAYSTDEGGSWTVANVPTGLTEFGDVSCTSAADCMATTTNDQSLGLIVATTDGGATWSLTPESSPQWGPYLSCTSASNCVAAEPAPTGSTVVMEETTDGWAQWSSTTLPSTIVAISGLSCGSATDCTAIATSSTSGSQVFLSTTDGGSTWTQQSASGAAPGLNLDVAGISCVSGSCVAVGSPPGVLPLDVVSRSTPESSWNLSAQPAGFSDGLQGVACPTTTNCIAVGGSLIATSETDGATWTYQSTPDNQSGLQAVACGSASTCVAVGGTTGSYAPNPLALAYFTTNGATWDTASLPGGITILRGVSCSGPSACFAVGETSTGAGVVVLTSNGGATWTTSTLPPGIGPLYTASCTSPTTCVIGGGVLNQQTAIYDGYILVTTDTGASWTSAQLPASTGSITAINCDSASDCVALTYTQVNTVTYPGATALVSTDGGGSWSDGQMLAGVANINDVSCSSVMNCTAVGVTDNSTGVILATSDGGANWELETLPAGTQQVFGVSCIGSSTCEAVGLDANGIGVILGPTAEPLYVATSLPLCFVSLPCSVTLSTTGGVPPYFWGSLTPLPNGLTLDGATGVISGTPTSLFDASLSIEVVDSEGNVIVEQVTFSIGNPPSPTAGPPPVITPPASSPGSSTGSTLPQSNIVGMASTPDGGGYWLVSATGAVLSFGDARSYGSMAGHALNAPIVGMAATPDGNGYWLLGQDGGVFSFGDASFYGSTGNIHLNQPVVGMATTPDGKGYWFVAADGGVFSYGDAPFYGSTGNLHLNKPVVGMAPTADGRGYYLDASDGGIFTFGDARFQGSMGGTRLNQPVVGMDIDRATGGYWLVAGDGGIFSFNAPYFGSTGNIRLEQPIVGIAAAPNGGGYRFVARDGGIFDFGNAQFYGSGT